MGRELREKKERPQSKLKLWHVHTCPSISTVVGSRRRSKEVREVMVVRARSTFWRAMLETEERKNWRWRFEIEAEMSTAAATPAATGGSRRPAPPGPRKGYLPAHNLRPTGEASATSRSKRIRFDSVCLKYQISKRKQKPTPTSRVLMTSSSNHVGQI